MCIRDRWRHCPQTSQESDRMHSLPDKAINLAIHTRWNIQPGNDTHNPELPMYTCCAAAAAMPYIHSEADNRAQCHSNVYYRRAEDISIEFNPLYIESTMGTLPLQLSSIRSTMGHYCATFTADNGANGTLWFDHSIFTWMKTSTQWHINAYRAITMLSTKSMTVAFKQWVNDNGLTMILAKFLEYDGKTIKLQYVTGENGMGYDNNATMSLHKSQVNEDNDVIILNNRSVRLGDDTHYGWQPRSPVTIMNSQMTMNIEAANGA
eukprot:2693777-Amphidinium_carterae.2